MKAFKRILSLVLSLVMLITSCCFAFYAFAVDDFGSGYDFQIYYYNENEEFVEVTEQVQVMEQYDVQLYACLVYSDGTVWNITESGMPVALDGYTVDWTSDARYLAFCENNDGNIHGYDATKGEAIRNWLDNEVGTIPVIGSSLESTLLALLDNDVTDIDDLDTEDVIKIVNTALEAASLQQYEEQLDASISEYLNKFDVGITATLKNADGESVASDTVRVLVLKSDKLLSDVVPNAAFIKNYDDIPTKVAVGYEMDLEGIITPVRTHYACEWTVTGQYGVLGSDIASVDENGHFTALSTGTVQVKVSPDITGLTENLTNAFNAMSQAGEYVDNETIAEAILLILGIQSGSDNYTTLVNIVSKILDSGVSVDGVLTFTDDVMAPLANFILYVIYQDAITIEIVAPSDIPITSYELSGNYSVTEGESSTLAFTNVKPDGAVAHDWDISIENEEIAVLTDELTFLGIDGSDTSLNYVTSKKTNIVCSMDGITNKYEVSVWGKNNNKVVYIKIGCDEYLDVNTPTEVNATTYPKRLDSSLSYGWVMSDGSYVFATDDTPAYTEDGLAYVTSQGVMYSTECTVNDLVVQEANGAVATKQIMSGIQTTGVEFTKKHFWTKCNSGTVTTGIRGSVCEVSANVLPANASFNQLTFTSRDTESVILSATPLTTAQYTSAALTEARRAEHASVTVTADENGYAVVYAYAIGNTSCYADISVATQTGGFTDSATVAFANVSVQNVSIWSPEDDDYLVGENSYQVTAGKQINFVATVQLSESGSWKNQGFEDVEWEVSDENLATITTSGILITHDVGTVTVTATSVFGEISSSVNVKILPDYTKLLSAMQDCDYDNLDSYDWSDDSWATFDAYYQEAVKKLEDNSFTSQREVDALAENIVASFNALVRYIPLEGISLYCSDDADDNGFATINVGTLSNYTNYSTQIVTTVYPEGAQDYLITYTSSDTSKLTVDENGVCTPVSSSDASWAKVTVTVTDPKNGNQFSKYMYVAFAKYQVASVSVNPESITFVGIGEDAETQSATISATYNSSSKVTSASIKYGFFVSSDDSVASVDSASGVVTPVGIGSCTVTCYSYDGGYTGVTNVVVTTNKNKLKSAIDKADAFVEEFFTKDSYLALTNALTDAKAVYDNNASTQEEINIATENLNTAIDNLQKNPYANVTISAGNGGAVVYNGETYTGDSNVVSVLIEDGMTVSAVADTGYHFVRWVDADGDEVSTNETETFSIDYSAYFKAEFSEIQSVTGVKLYTEGNDVEYYTKTVGALSSYTSASVKLTNVIYPSNANFYTVQYQTSSSAVNVSQDGTVTPSSNNTCYAVVEVVATNSITGEQFKDSVTVAFVKYALSSVSANPNSMTFYGTASPQQSISITYSASSSVTTPSLRQGFFESDNNDVATVDSNGVVTPIGVGTCSIKFTSYDGGLTANTTIFVYADKTVLEQTLKTANAIVVEDYTADSYANLPSAIADAQKVYKTEYATQEEVDSVTSALQSAIESLVPNEFVTVTLSVNGNGHIEMDDTQVSSVKVNNGDTVVLNAVADEDYMLDGWYDQDGNIISQDTTLTINPTSSTTIVAKFKAIPYIQSVTATYKGEKTDFAEVSVSLVSRYTNSSATFDVDVYPSDANYTVVGYSLGNPSNNLTLSGSTVKPSSNDSAYGQVVVTVLDNYSGKTYTDVIYVAFAKYLVYSVSASPASMTFSGLDSAPQTISVSYTGANSLSTPNICDGFFVSSDEDVATVSSSGVVTPVGKGNCEITFYSYDAGRTSTTSVTVNSNPSLSGRIVAMDSPKYDTGTSPVAGAKITIGDTTVVTDENGEFKFDSVPASSKLTAVVTYETGVTRTVNITMQTDNKVLADIPIITVDYANDGYINAKDYACMKRSGASEEQFTRFDNFLSANGYATGFYPNLNL